MVQWYMTTLQNCKPLLVLYLTFDVLVILHRVSFKTSSHLTRTIIAWSQFVLCAFLPMQTRRAAPPREQRHQRPGPPPFGAVVVPGGGGFHPLLQPVERRQVLREGGSPPTPCSCSTSATVSFLMGLVFPSGGVYHSHHALRGPLCAAHSRNHPAGVHGWHPGLPAHRL